MISKERKRWLRHKEQKAMKPSKVKIINNQSTIIHQAFHMIQKCISHIRTEL